METKIRRSGVPIDIDESKMCPFAERYDADLHDFLSYLRRVDGSLPVHPLYGPQINLFAPKDSSKCWIHASTPSPVLGYFLFLVLDKVVYPFLVKYFEMPIWHPTSERTLDKLLHAKVDM
jgi:hypothetical protein